MGDIFKRLTNLARAEISHFTHRDHEFSQEFMDYFKQQPEYQNHRSFFEDDFDARLRQDQESKQSGQQSSQQRKRSNSDPGFDPYATLEISPNASFEEIEKAYRKMARKYHPDRYQDEKERETATKVMALINASYSFLKQKHGKK